ncbi:unnamed protein product [Owenia fusiformis]|uniref:Uncharacterized protein n=1 Tax=Owenia fusiformis TaxID=6347 RepID=A0A8J1TYL6_OWEFU|nr:unnamed protein product [Owenia fusiformis]
MACLIFGAYLFICVFLPENVFGQATDVRLVGGTTEYAGRVELLYTGQWGTICSDGWDRQDAAVICRMMNFTGEFKEAYTTDLGTGTGPIWLTEVDCDGNEQSINDCRHTGWGSTTCKRGVDRDAGVVCIIETETTTQSSSTVTTTPKTTTTTTPETICDNPSSTVRLTGGRNSAQGIVEVLYNSTWGSVCDDKFGQNNADVVCRSLCYSIVHAKAVLGEFGNITTNDYWMDEVVCNGSEGNIEECPFAGWGVHNCDPTEAAGVRCEPESTPELPVPEPVVQCTSNTIDIAFALAVDGRLKEEHLSLKDGTPADCGFKTSSNTSYVTAHIPMKSCGTERTTNSTHIIYTNELIHNIVPEGIIRRDNEYTITVHCIHPRDSGASGGINPETKTLPPGIGEHNFDVEMYFYRNFTFKEPITEFPIRISLGDWLHVGVVLKGSDPTLKLIVPECFATPLEDKTSTPRYDLIRDKCKADSTVTYYPFNETVFAFRFQSFAFNDYTTMYLHCDAFICESDEKNDQCDRTCRVQGRKRRSADMRDILHIDKGPIIIEHIRLLPDSSTETSPVIKSESTQNRWNLCLHILGTIIMCLLTVLPWRWT